MGREFKIQITTAADMAGQEKASAGLKSFTQQTEESNVKTREMHRLFGEINRVLPGVGEALHAAFAEGGLAPTLLGAGLIANALSQVRDHLLDIQQKGREAFLALEEAAIAAQQKIIELKKTDDEYWQDRQRHLEEEQGKNVFDLAVKKIQEQVEADKKVLETQEAAEKAAVDAAAREGHISDQDAAERKRQIDAKYRGLNLSGDAAAVAAENAERQKRVDEQQAKIDAQTNLLHRARDLDTGAKGAGLRGDIGQFETFKKLVEQRTSSNEAIYSSEVPLAVKALLDWKHNPMSSIGFSMASNFDVNTIQSWINSNQKQLDDSARTQELLKKDIDNEQAIVDALKQQIADSKQQQEITSGAAGRIATAQGRIDQLKALSDLGVLGAGTFFPGPHIGQQLYTNPAAQDIFSQGAAALQAQSHLRPGQYLSDAQQQAIARLHQLEQSIGWAPQLIQSIDRLITSHQNMFNVVGALQTRIGVLESQLKAGAVLNHQ